MDDAIDRSTPSVAVLGCGGWGKNIVRTLHSIQPIPVIADPSEAGRATAAELAPDAVVTNNPAVIFDDPAIDAVMIATPAETHFELAKRAIEAGKDVFVEKPLTIDLDEARALVQLAGAHGRLLMVGHLLEYHPAILKLHDLIKQGELGEVRYVISNRLNLGKVRTHENALWSFAPHDIAVILRLVGQDPTEVVATGGSYVSPGIADVTVTQLLFPKGVRSHVFVSWLHPFKEQRLVVVGSKKMASFDDVNKELVLYDQRVDLEEGQPVPVKGEGTAVEFDTATSPLEAEVRHFIERVIDRQPARTHGASGVKVLEILHAAQESIGQGGGAISLVQERPIVEAKLEATHARV
ncbi:MAG: Gfo/Idh/MocA family oxidoreductase [Phycisphaerales bacterium]